MNREEFYKKKLEQCQKELSEIELTNDRTRRERWRHLKKVESWLNRELNNAVSDN